MYEFYSKKILKDTLKKKNFFYIITKKYLIITNRTISNINEKKCEYEVFIMFFYESIRF